MTSWKTCRDEWPSCCRPWRQWSPFPLSMLAKTLNLFLACSRQTNSRVWQTWQTSFTRLLCPCQRNAKRWPFPKQPFSLNSNMQNRKPNIGLPCHAPTPAWRSFRQRRPRTTPCRLSHRWSKLWILQLLARLKFMHHLRRGCLPCANRSRRPTNPSGSEKILWLKSTVAIRLGCRRAWQLCHFQAWTDATLNSGENPKSGFKRVH